MNTKYFAILMIMALLAAGCRKEVHQETAQQQSDFTVSLDEAKAFLAKDTARPIIYWDQATYVRNRKFSYWLVGLSGRPVFNKLKLGYRKAAIFRDSTGNISASILEFIPDALYLQKKKNPADSDFTGRVFEYDLRHRLLSGKVYSGGRQVGLIKSVSTAAGHLQTDKVEPVVQCAWAENNYVDADGTAVIYAEEICLTSFVDVGQGDGNGPTWSAPVSGQPGEPPAGGGSSAPSAPPPASNLPGENKAAVIPKDMMKCFQNLPDAGSAMQITVYVQESWPGTTFNIGPNSVGHTAISLTKINGGQRITQTVGFYPDATGLAKVHAPSKIVDNGGDLEYNASISYTVNAADFNKIVNYISNPPSTYDISDFNCTNFVVEACQAGNITLPNAVTYSQLYQAGPVLTPATLGDSIEKMKGNPNVNANGGMTPFSNGPCK